MKRSERVEAMAAPGGVRRYRRLLKACLSLFRVQTAEGFQYRAAALSGVVTSLVWAFVEVVAFTVFFKYADNAGVVGGLTLAQTISHVWVRELLLFLQPFSIDGVLLRKIDNGDVGVEMCRPLDLYWHWFARTSSGKVVMAVMRCLVCFLIGFLIPGGYGAGLPVSLAALIAFIPSVLCAFALCSAYNMLVTALRMDVSWGNAPMYFMLLISQVLSGGYLALQLWPGVMQRFLLYQPFAGMCDIPARLYIGSMPPSDAFQAMGIQLAWTLVFILLGRWVMARRLRGIIAQGG